MLAQEFGQHLADLEVGLLIGIDRINGPLYSLSGVMLVLLGTFFGLWRWIVSNSTSHPATSGTVMLAALPIIIGIQCLIAFLDGAVRRRLRLRGTG